MRTRTSAPGERGGRSSAALPWLAIPAAAFAYGLSFSWGRWGELVVDWGRELEIARRLAAGDVLYGDVRYWYGPVAPT